MSANTNRLWKPSDARVITIDSFIPTPRGGRTTAPSPLHWAAKDPSDVLDYQVDFSPALVGDDGDTIASIDVHCVPDEYGDLAIRSAVADGSKVILWASDGRADTVYNVTIDVTTVNGRRIQRGILLPVISMTDPLGSANAIEVSEGLLLYDSDGNPVLI